ncbi:hypothetical protein GCM10027168_01880 [Streptomyces capparidis]
MHHIRNAAALGASLAVFGLLTWTSAVAERQPEGGRGVTIEPDSEPADATKPDGHTPGPERPSTATVPPAAPQPPASPDAPPAHGSGPGVDDGKELGESNPGEAATPPRAPVGQPKDSGSNQDQDQDQRRGLFDKENLGDVLDRMAPGGERIADAVPDWASPLRAYLTTVADTAVELEVTATDPQTDAVTVTATLTAADGSAEGVPLVVEVTVTPPPAPLPGAPTEVAVEVTNTATGERATAERESTPEAVTVMATVATVTTVSDVLADGRAADAILTRSEAAVPSMSVSP